MAIWLKAYQLKVMTMGLRQVTTIASASCADVREEVLARVESKTWHDPHNGGLEW